MNRKPETDCSKNGRCANLLAIHQHTTESHNMHTTQSRIGHTDSKDTHMKIQVFLGPPIRPNPYNAFLDMLTVA